jgi:hypothetical protein
MCSHPAITYAARTGNRKGDEEMNPELPTENQREGGSMKMSAEGQIESEQYSLAKILGI